MIDKRIFAAMAVILLATSAATAAPSGCVVTEKLFDVATVEKVAGRYDSIVYIGLPGSLISAEADKAFGSTHPIGTGAFVMTSRSEDEVIIGFIDPAPARAKVCDSRTIKKAEWEAIKLAALGPTV